MMTAIHAFKMTRAIALDNPPPHEVLQLELFTSPNNLEKRPDPGVLTTGCWISAISGQFERAKAHGGMCRFQDARLIWAARGESWDGFGAWSSRWFRE